MLTQKDPEKSTISTYDHVSTQPQSNVPAIRWKCLTHLTQKLSKHVQCAVFFGGWNRRCAYIFQSEQGRSNLPELITNQDGKAIVERLDEVCTCLAVQTSESIKISFKARTFSWYEISRFFMEDTQTQDLLASTLLQSDIWLPNPFISSDDDRKWFHL